MWMVQMKSFSMMLTALCRRQQDDSLQVGGVSRAKCRPAHEHSALIDHSELSGIGVQEPLERGCVVTARSVSVRCPLISPSPETRGDNKRTDLECFGRFLGAEVNTHKRSEFRRIKA
ncbi:hypothetical protein MHYP_G00020080 [Metynnis hypsauchen]